MLTMKEAAAALPDGITAKTVYVSRDGDQFDHLSWAVARNEELDRIDAANAILDGGGTVYDAAIASGRQTVDDVLRLVTKDTGLSIPHWQCQDEPGYRVIRFTRDGIDVWGDAGSWSGPYGNVVSLMDLARYAKNTLADCAS